MHHLIQHGKIRSQVINVPEGFPELLSDITREVLRCQPTTECLCQFLIDYLHSIIVARDKARIAKNIIDQALLTVDEIIADMCVCDITKTKADQMSEAMEECFRRFLAQRRCKKGKKREIIKFNEFDMLDELIKKCKFSDDELKISRPVIEAAYQKFVDAYMSAQENTDVTESLYQYFREREIKRSEERLRAEAAIKIQSNFRGFLVRRSLFLDKPPKVAMSISSKNGEDLMQKEIAARKIQQYFRHYKRSGKFQMNIEQDLLCSPASKVSLAAHPVDFHDIKQQVQPHEQSHQEEKHHNDELHDIVPRIDFHDKEQYEDVLEDKNKGLYDKEQLHNEELLNKIEPRDDLYEDSITLGHVKDTGEQRSEKAHDHNESTVK